MKTEQLKIRGIQTYAECHGNKKSSALILLHGFTGSSATWRNLAAALSQRYYVIAVDLIGHGRTESPESPERYRMQEQVEDLHLLLQHLEAEKPFVLGYSMGGRIALSYTAAYPDEVSALILESSSPGLRTADERTARSEADEKLAERIENDGIEKFVDFWQEIPLFQTQKKLSSEQRLAVRKERLSQNPAGLANSLRGIGTGSQPSNWELLERLPIPVLLITGSLDEKFEKIAENMARMLPDAQHESVENAGHAIHVEKPLQFATMIKSYLEQHNE